MMILEASIQASPPKLVVEMDDERNRLKKAKASGQGNITLEEIESLGDFGIEIITKVINGKYNSEQIPNDLLKSIFIAPPKKVGALEFEDYNKIYESYDKVVTKNNYEKSKK